MSIVSESPTAVTGRPRWAGGPGGGAEVDGGGGAEVGTGAVVAGTVVAGTSCAGGSVW